MADIGRRTKNVAKAAAAFIQRLPALRLLTAVTVLPALALEPEAVTAAAAETDVGVAILLRKRFQSFHRGSTESASASATTEGTLLLDTREDEDEDRRTNNVGLLSSLFGANLSRG
jgi:hypothetical protein